MKTVLILGCIFIFTSCTSYIPEEEMFLAETALEAAKEAKADIHSTQYFQKALDYLKASKKAKQDREFDLAKKFALQAMSYAEKAEDEAVLKQEQVTLNNEG